jgi:hypothetical protein
MGQQITLQKQITMTGDTSSEDYNEPQSMDEFADVSGWGAAFITVHTLTVSVASGDQVMIGIPTVNAKRNDGLEPLPEGAASPCVGFFVTGNQWYRALVGRRAGQHGGDTYPMENLLGWHLSVHQTTGGGPFSVTFEIFVTLKRPS